MKTPVLNKLNQQKLSYILKRKATDNVCEKPYKLIHNERRKTRSNTNFSQRLSYL